VSISSVITACDAIVLLVLSNSLGMRVLMRRMVRVLLLLVVIWLLVHP
jgi:hypothetical protein